MMNLQSDYYSCNPANIGRQPVSFWQRYLLPWTVLIFSIFFWYAFTASLIDMLEVNDNSDAMILAIEGLGSA